MFDPVLQADWDTALHESGHAFVAWKLGRQVLRITGSRHKAEDGFAGTVEYMRDATDGYGEAMIALAGGVAELSFTEMLLFGSGDTSDEQKARRECPLGWKHAKTEVWLLLQTRPAQRALTALCHALSEAGGEIGEFRMKEVLHE